MKRLEEFRLYYNHTLHPELMRMERRRIRLLRLLFFSALVLFALVVFAIYLNILAITLVLMLPIGFYIGYLGYRIRLFIQTFKPNIVNLILDFIGDTPNYGMIKYDEKKKIDKETFKKSGIFSSPMDYYIGEDYFEGKIGEMNFKFSELRVREVSKVSNKLQEIFEGVFIYAQFNEQIEGRLIAWPRSERQYATRAVKHFTWNGGENVDDEILNDNFREKFSVYATEDTHVVGILTEPMQEELLTFLGNSDRKMYLSFMDREIFCAISESKDLLEPNLFQSNLSFDLIREFYIDISRKLSVVRNFDQNL
ncbi:MAG: DUF3137 domain-containing protein [Saprospiraceae bacterium]